MKMTWNSMKLWSDINEARTCCNGAIENLSEDENVLCQALDKLINNCTAEHLGWCYTDEHVQATMREQREVSRLVIVETCSSSSILIRVSSDIWSTEVSSTLLWFTTGWDWRPDCFPSRQSHTSWPRSSWTRHALPLLDSPCSTLVSVLWREKTEREFTKNGGRSFLTPGL